MFFILFGSLSPSIFVLFRLLIRVQSSLLYYYVASVFKQQAINNLKFASQISNQRGTEKIRFFLDFHETRVVWSVVRRVYKFVIDKNPLLHSLFAHISHRSSSRHSSSTTHESIKSFIKSLKSRTAIAVASITDRIEGTST
jgi:hypothetical protein